MGASTGVQRGPRAETSTLLLLLALASFTLAEKQGSPTPESSQRSGSRGLFAPRVEYDEWTPLGHGDPLKNDPTYDYVPPVLERVRYWLEPPSRAPPPPQHPPRTSPTRPSPHTSSHNTHHPTHTHTYIQPTLDSRRDSYPFLTLVDAPKFNLPTSHYKTPAPPHYLPRPHYTQPPPYRTLPPSLAPSRVTTPPPVLTPVPSLAPVTTPASALTTDPLFAHYKQPAEPLQGPMYLIIEGHSKVKTYGAGKTIHGIPVHEGSRRQKRRRKRRLRKRSIFSL